MKETFFTIVVMSILGNIFFYLLSELPSFDKVIKNDIFENIWLIQNKIFFNRILHRSIPSNRLIVHISLLFSNDKSKVVEQRTPVIKYLVLISEGWIINSMRFK